MANSDKELKNQKDITKEKKTQLDYDAQILKYEEDIINANIRASELKKKIAELVKVINTGDKKAAKKAMEELKTKKQSLDLLNKEQKIKQSISDIGDDVVDAMDKEALLGYDIQANLKKLKKTKNEIVQLEEKLKGLKGPEAKRLREEIDGMKQSVGLATDAHKINTQAANLAQQTLMVQDKALGVLNLSVGALRGMVVAAKAFVAALMANPIIFTLSVVLAAAVFALGTGITAAKGFNEQLGASAGQSVRLSARLTESRLSLKLLGIDGNKVATDLIDNFGTLGSATDDNVYQIGEMERMLGIASSDTAKFAKSFTSLTGDTMGAALNMAEFAGSLAQSNDVAPGKVMADIASSTEEFAAYGKDGGKNIVEAAIAARKLGLELKTLTRISDTLLDFESSIQSEMEASMLIGKQLNYNKARELALQGDIAGAAQDVMKQVGGAAEFQKLNVIQRRKLAASIGVSVEEMSKLASGKLEIKDDKSEAEKNTEKLRDLTGSQEKLITATDALKKATYVLAAAMAVNMGMKLFNKFKGSKTPDVPKTGKVTPDRSKGFYDKKSKRFRSSSGQIMSNADAKAAGLDKRMTKNLTKEGGENVSKKVAKEGTKNIVKKKIKQETTEAVGKNVVKKAIGKGAGKTLLKKIPGVSIIAGLAFASQRLMAGDGIGAIGELASGIASTLPGLGTAASVAIDAALIAKDVNSATKDANDIAKEATDIAKEIQGPPEGPGSPTEVQKAQAAIAEKQAIFEAEQKAIAAEEEKKLLEEKERLEKERQATLAAEAAILEQQVQLQNLKSQLEQSRTVEANSKASIARALDPETKQVLSESGQKARMQMFERNLEQSKRDQAELIAAIEKLTRTTAGLVDTK